MLKKTNREVDKSSAQWTAIWRSAEPEISKDTLSVKLSSADGAISAERFISENDYPLVVRTVSVRAGFILHHSLKLALTKKYDSAISFASGLSLLTYYLAIGLKEQNFNFQIYDTDLAEIILERKSQLQKLNKDDYDYKIMSNIIIQIIDLENAAKEGLHLKDLFPSCARPIFIIEGVVYYLSATCIDWLLKEMQTYEQHALIFDYWLEEDCTISTKFANVISQLKKLMREEPKSFIQPGYWTEQRFARMTFFYDKKENIGIQDAEEIIINDLNNKEKKLINPNQFFPVHLFVGEKNSPTKNIDITARKAMSKL